MKAKKDAQVVKNKPKTTPALPIFAALSALFGSGAIIGLTLFSDPANTLKVAWALAIPYAVCFIVLFLLIWAYGSIYPPLVYVSLPVATLACGARTAYTSFFNPLAVALIFILLCAATLIACLWALHRYPMPAKKPAKSWVNSTFAILGLCVAAALSLCLFITVFQGRLDWLQTDRTPQAEIGQMLYYMQHSGQAFTTLIAHAPQSYFATQFAPLWYLLLPVYALFDHSMLAVGIALYALMLSALIPLWRICRKLSLSYMQTAALGIALACSPLLIGGGSVGGTLGMLSLPLLLWVADALLGKRPYLALIPLILCLGIGFEVTLWTAFICFYLAMSVRCENRRAGLVCTAVAVIGLIATTVYLIIVQSPVISNLFASIGIQFGKKLLFWVLLALPFALLPLFSGQKWALVLLVPYTLFHLVANASVFSGVFCTYAYPVIAAMAILSAHGTAKLHTEIKGIALAKLLPALAVCAAIVLSMPYASVLAQLYVPKVEAETETEQEQAQLPEHEFMHKILAQLPQNASITASDTLLCALHDRTWLFSLSRDPAHPQTNVIVLDLREDFIPSDMESYDVAYYQSLGYTLRDDLSREGILAVLFK